MGFGTISNTFINCGRHSMSIHSNSYSSFGCCGFGPGCFGFGFNPVCGNPFAFGAGAGLGYAAGMMLPGVLTGIGRGVAWLWNKIF